MKRHILSLAAIVAMSLPATAQHAGHAAPQAVDLPPVCLENAGDAMPMAAGHDMGGSEAHRALMGGMDKMNSDMMAGGTATDIDVAFVCSMIPHHRGAIDMARAELDHGDDPWAKELAQAIIAAQEQEIADMLVWLEKQPTR
jgi:uncharacterized protein (DUF305 family)